MLKFKSVCEVELLKKEYNVIDDLVRINKSVEFFDGSLFDYEANLIAEYLKKEAATKDKVVEFFQKAIKNDISKVKYWVNYLDTLMDERYVEDGELLYEYDAKVDSPLAIRGSRKEIEKFIKTIIFIANKSIKDLGDYKNGISKSIISRSSINKIIITEFKGDINQFCKYVLNKIDFAELKKDFDAIEVEKCTIDRAYYEQRAYSCPV